MFDSSNAAKQDGFSLIELIITLSLTGLVALVLLVQWGFVSGRSADPALQVQSRLIAQALLSEVHMQAFYDPSVDPSLVACSPTPNACPTPEPERSQWNNVCDYQGYDSLATGGLRNQSGQLLDGLAGYRAQVFVDQSAELRLGPSGHALSNDDFTRLLHIQVQVTSPDQQTLSLSAWRVSPFAGVCS